MPLYEYVCLDCLNRFEVLRPMIEADAPIACENCESERTSRALSLFYAQSQSGNGDRGAGSCACGGSCSCGN